MDLEKLPQFEAEVERREQLSLQLQQILEAAEHSGGQEDRRHAKPPLTPGPTPGGRGGAVLGKWCCMFTITSSASISGLKLEIKILTEAAPLSSWAIKAPKHASSGAGLLSETTPPFPNLGPAKFEEAEAISSCSLSVIGVGQIPLPRLSYVFTSRFPFSSASHLLPEKSFFHKGWCR